MEWLYKYFQAVTIYDEDIHNIASAYFKYYIENNNPAVDQFLYLYEEEPMEYLSEATAKDIRKEISDLLDYSINERIVQDTFSESISLKAYLKSELPQKIIIHLINYDDEIQGDRVKD